MRTNSSEGPGRRPFLLNDVLERALASLKPGCGISVDAPPDSIWIDAYSTPFFSAVTSICELGLEGRPPFRIVVTKDFSFPDPSKLHRKTQPDKEARYIRIAFGTIGPPYSERVGDAVFDIEYLPNPNPEEPQTLRAHLSTFEGCILANGGFLDVVGDKFGLEFRAYHKIVKPSLLKQTKGHPHA